MHCPRPRPREDVGVPDSALSTRALTGALLEDELAGLGRIPLLIVDEVG
jgi:hypothetical protein